MLKYILIALVIYLFVVMRSRIRLPHPGMQAAVDILTAADLSDGEVIQMARSYIHHSDSQHKVAGTDTPYGERLERLTDRFVAVNGVKLNFKAYHSDTINAFATADGSIRLYTGLMDRMSDDELMAIIGHEMGHIRNNDTLSAMRKAYLTSAARGALGAVGGTLGQLSASQLGGIAQQYATAQFSQQQEYRADDFSLGFLQRNHYDPFAISRALQKLHDLSSQNKEGSGALTQLFSTHPESAQRAARMHLQAQQITQRNLPA